MKHTKNIELITTNALGFPPFIMHRAILFYNKKGQPLIMHRTTSGAEIIDYATFMQGRQILHRETFPIVFDFDPVTIVKEDTKPFDWMNNNCEDFTSQVIEQTTGKTVSPKSPQRAAWIGILIVILLTMILIKL